MNHAGIIRRCRDILQEAGAAVGDQPLEASNFLDFADHVRDAINDWPREKRAAPGMHEFALGLRTLRDDFEAIVAADPMCIYRPAHKTSLEFHRSTARTRYYRAPNRSSKTQSGVAEGYWTVTGQHPWLPRPPLPASVAIVVFQFTKNMAGVFTPKYVDGEAGNPLSPAFPKGGKWFYHYDERKYILKIACPQCAEAGTAGSCKHAKSTILFFSSQEDLTAYAGGQYALVHLDEQIPYPFFTEATQRIKTVPNSGIVVSETPLGGKGFWTHKILTRDAKARKRVGDSGRLLVSLHTCTQYETGLYPKEEIDADCEQMTDQQIEARVNGRPAAYSEHGVFNKVQISDMIAKAKPPILRGLLMLEGEKFSGENTADLLEEADDDTTVKILPDADGELRVWELPKKYAQYVIGADVAEGMTGNDASCAQVLKMERKENEMNLTHVASWHGWVNSLAYGPELFKLSILYNLATIIPERRGPGDATVNRLKELNCWTLFRDTADPAAATFTLDTRYGMDTNVSTKSMYVAMLQYVIWHKRTRKRRLECWDEDTLEEIGTFGQEKTQSGLTYRFRGEGEMPDDRVMGLALAAYGAVAGDIYDVWLELEARRAQEEEETGLTERDKRIWKQLREEDAMLQEERFPDE
jgi:hypothetical protein